MDKNYAIRCDVRKCVHNAEGCNCELESIKVTCPDGEGYTRCNSFCRREI